MRRPKPSELLAQAEREFPKNRLRQSDRFADLMMEHRYWLRARHFGQALIAAVDQDERTQLSGAGDS